MQHQAGHRRQEDSREDAASAEAGEQTAASGSEVSAEAARMMDAVEDLLNEIENPQEWVAGFQQKGGQ
ncbi:ubiquitin-like protein Pup [Streptomyces sp. NPDC001514]